MLYVGVSNLFFSGVLLDRDQYVLHVKSMCVCVCDDDGHRYLKLSQDCIRKLQVIFPPASLAVGIGEREDGFYLSPRMAYWLSNCSCCVGPGPSPSLARLLCLTTSKVFSISLSLRVSTCLAVERREGNWASL